MDWHAIVEVVAKYVVRVKTPTKEGTGLIVRQNQGLVTVATAAHVVRDAYAWKQAVTIVHPSGEIAEAPPTDGSGSPIILHATNDVASVIGDGAISAALHEPPVDLVPLTSVVRPGVEVGWLGFPFLVDSPVPCFFAGHVSAYIPGTQQYYIDGVAIRGTSGGPAFLYDKKRERVVVLGTVSQYRAGGESLPGLLVADRVIPLLDAGEKSTS